MNKSELISETTSELKNLQIVDLIKLKHIILNLKLDKQIKNDNKELKFDWEGILQNEKISSVELQKEALNWR